MKLRNRLAKNYINAVGWRTNRKLLVIESDDWGSIRMPSKKVYEKAKALGFQLENKNYDTFDSIEGAEDIMGLLETLASVKDKNGNGAILTACTNVANPDFEKIEASNRTQYFYEPFTESYKRFARCEGTLNLIKEGIEKKLFVPQFHGREHINVERYLKAIKSRSVKEQFCFENQAILGSLIPNDLHFSYFGAYDYTEVEEENNIRNIIKDGLSLFENIFGYRSKSYMMPTNHYGVNANKFFAENGVLFNHGGSQNIRQPNGKLIRKNLMWGQKDADGITYWRRNCTFEPSRNQNFDWVDSCLREIKIAFFWGKPAVINSHRVNYIGSLCEKNREESLKKLKILLSSVIKRWPEVEFISSEHLAIMLEKDRY